MSYLCYLLLLYSFTVLCNPGKAATVAATLRLHQLKKLFVTGDFDGDGRMDSLYQYNYSGRSKSEISHSPDPGQNDWDDVAHWLDEQQAEVRLTTGKAGQDTLHFGIAQGLYCLINTGDNNGDGKDEIALVVDYPDMSRVNSCKIYTLCNGRWTLIKEFGVPEGAFDFMDGIPRVFSSIKDFLEQRNGHWVYRDYFQDNDADDMQPLKLNRCSE